MVLHINHDKPTMIRGLRFPAFAPNHSPTHLPAVCSLLHGSVATSVWPRPVQSECLAAGRERTGWQCCPSHPAGHFFRAFPRRHRPAGEAFRDHADRFSCADCSLPFGSATHALLSALNDAVCPRGFLVNWIASGESKSSTLESFIERHTTCTSL